MLWGLPMIQYSLDRREEPYLFAAFGVSFMASSWITNILPFWILGVPLVVSIISYMRLPSQRRLATSGRDGRRHDDLRESHIRTGEAAVSRG